MPPGYPHVTASNPPLAGATTTRGLDKDNDASSVCRAYRGLNRVRPVEGEPVVSTNVPDQPTAEMSVTEHVHEAWRPPLQPPDGEPEHVTGPLAGAPLLV